MLERLLISGSGGQGVILMGKLLATVATKDTPHVTFFPAYGAEVRGGSASCQAIFSSREIPSPVSDVFDSLILMNQASVAHFEALVGTSGLVLVNSSLCQVPPGPRIHNIPATELAHQLGDTRAANFVMLGAYVARKPFLPAVDVEAGIRQAFADKSPALIDLSVRGFQKGLALPGAAATDS